MNEIKQPKTFKTVGELVNVLEKYDFNTSLRVLNEFVLYGINIIVPQNKNMIILAPNKKSTKCVKTKKF